MQVTIKQVEIMAIFHPVLICFSIGRFYNSILARMLHRDERVCGSTLGKSGSGAGEQISQNIVNTLSSHTFQIWLTTFLGVFRLVRLLSPLRWSSGDDDGAPTFVRLVYHFRFEIIWNALWLQ